MAAVAAAAILKFNSSYNNNNNNYNYNYNNNINIKYNVVGLFRSSNSIRSSSITASSCSRLQFPPSHRLQYHHPHPHGPHPILPVPNTKPRFRIRSSSSSSSSSSSLLSVVSSEMSNLSSIISNIPSCVTYYWKSFKYFSYSLAIEDEEHCHFTLRIVVRDDEHHVTNKLTESVMQVYDAWRELDIPSKCEQKQPIAAIVVQESIRCLLENEHLWVCGASKVSLSFSQLYENLSAILEEEAFELLTSKRTEDPINCVEFILQLCLIGEFSDGGIHTRADLAKALQQLHTNYHIKSATPEFKSFQVDKEKLDRLRGYLHITAAQNPLKE